MGFRSIFLSALIVLCCFIKSNAQDWPQYLGPERNGTSSQEDILRTWPADGPEVLWAADVGIGYGGAVVKDNKLYYLDRDNQYGDYMRCFSLSTGEELWQYGYEAPGEIMFPGSRSVPLVDGNHVYSCGPYGDLYCFDINTQKPVWNKNIWTDFGGEEIPRWAITQCPLSYDELVIVASQAPEAGVVAYNKNSGELVWKTPALGPVGYVSPNIIKIDGEDHVVMVTASEGGRNSPVEPGSIVGIHPLSGEILWEFNNWVCRIPVPPAIDAGDNKVLVVGGYELGALMIKVEKQADGKYGTTEIFRTEEFGDQTKAPLLIDGYFYAQFGTNRTRDGLTCMNMDGEIMWKTERDPDFNKGSMIYAEGLILATDGATKLYLIQPDPSGFKPLASAEMLGQGGTDSEGGAARVGGSTQNWAPIALADGKLLIRDQSRLMCVKVAK